MACDEIQQSLLRGHEPSGVVTAHLAGCAACAEFEEKATALDHAVRAMPAPADSDAARDRFLDKLAAMRQPIIAPQAPVLLRITRSRWAVAAAVVLAVGGGTWVYLAHQAGELSKTIAQTPAIPPTSVAASTDPAPLAVEILGRTDEDLLAQLVSHNVELAEIRSPDQRRTAYKRGALLRQKMRVAKLSPNDRKVVDTLLGDSDWIANHDDPLATADRFGDVANLLVDRMNTAGASDESMLKLGKAYCMVVDRGIYQNLDRAGASGKLTADHQKNLARIIQNHERLQHRLEVLMEKYPNATRQEIRKAMEAGKLQHRKKTQGQAVPPVSPFH